MSSSTSNSSLARSRNLRVPPPNSLKPPSTSTPPCTPGPSNIALFLTNLRLLDLDLRNDWPDITDSILSTKDAKKRIQCVEWALYQLFALWDPEETCNKLQPFFPPLEPLQSLNLRAALFRCLDQAKKNGVLGKDIVLRKTMLDECKGERLEEVLALFSNAVIKKMLQDGGSEEHQAISQQLAFENFSYTGERTVLSALILAHKASLCKHLQDKEDARAKYDDFSDLLNLNDRRIARRHEQLKQVIEDRGNRDILSDREVGNLQDQVQKNWSGSENWLESVLYGDSRVSKDGVLATRFVDVWNHVEQGRIGDVEGRQYIGLLEQLDRRVKDQENRLARWQDFGRSLSKTGTSSPSKKKNQTLVEQNGIDLAFSEHQTLQLGRTNTDEILTISGVSLEEYMHLIENMRSELADVGKPKTKKIPARQSLDSDKRRSMVSVSRPPKEVLPAAYDEEWSSATDSDGVSPGFNATKSTSQTPPSEAPATGHRMTETEPDPAPVEKAGMAPTKKTVQAKMERHRKTRYNPSVAGKPRSKSPPKQSRTPPPPDPSSLDLEADQILDSMTATSPSPTKKPRHTLSLAERTRLSMSRASHSQFSDMHDDYDNLADLPSFSSRKPGSPTKAQLSETEKVEKHADLIERTRQSMAGFEAAQKKAQIERRKSQKDAKRRETDARKSYFPKVQEEVATPDVGAMELIEGDPDYESVFKSRPKIKTSPAVSPERSRVWEEDGDD